MTDDTAIEIHAVTEYALAELTKRFPGEEFDLIVRDFAPSIHIRIRKTQLSELLKGTSEGFVFEEFGLDTPSAQGTMHYISGERMNYEKTIAFLKDLKDVPVLEELKQTVGYESLIPWMRDYRSSRRVLVSEYAPACSR